MERAVIPIITGVLGTSPKNQKKKKRLEIREKNWDRADHNTAGNG